MEIYNDGRGTFSGAQNFRFRCDTDSVISFISCTTENADGKPSVSGNLVTFRYQGNVRPGSYDTLVFRIISGEGFEDVNAA